MELIEVAKDDLIKLVEAILEFPVHLVGDCHGHYFCEYCDSTLDEMKDPKEFIHAKSCPVMTAKRLKENILCKG
jgi:hypothetical protein